MLNWGKWVEGLLNSILGGVGTAGAGYCATLITGAKPEWSVLGTMVLVAAGWNFFSYIRDHRITVVEEVTTTVKTETTVPAPEKP